MSKKITSAEFANAVLTLQASPGDRDAARVFYGGVKRYLGAIAARAAYPLDIRDEFVSAGVEAAWQLMPKIPIKYDSQGNLLFEMGAWIRGFPYKRACEAVSRGVVVNKKRGIDWEERAIAIVPLDGVETSTGEVEKAEHARIEIESILKPILPADQLEIMMLACGLTSEGIVEVAAIAKRLGCTPQSVYGRLAKAKAVAAAELRGALL